MKIEECRVVHKFDEYYYGYYDKLCFQYSNDFVLLKQVSAELPYNFGEESTAIQVGYQYQTIQGGRIIVFKKDQVLEVIKLPIDQPVEKNNFTRNRHALLFCQQNVVYQHIPGTDDTSQEFVQLFQKSGIIGLHNYENKIFIIFADCIRNQKYEVIYQFNTPMDLVHKYNNILAFRTGASEIILFDLNMAQLDKDTVFAECPAFIIDNTIAYANGHREHFNHVRDASNDEICFKQALEGNKELMDLYLNLNKQIQEFRQQIEDYIEQNTYSIMLTKMQSQKQRICQRSVLQTTIRVNELLKFNHQQLMNKYVLNSRYWEAKYEETTEQSNKLAGTDL